MTAIAKTTVQIVHGFLSRKKLTMYRIMNITLFVRRAKFGGFGISNKGNNHCKQYILGCTWKGFFVIANWTIREILLVSVLPLSLSPNFYLSQHNVFIKKVLMINIGFSTMIDHKNCILEQFEANSSLLCQPCWIFHHRHSSQHLWRIQFCLGRSTAMLHGMTMTSSMRHSWSHQAMVPRISRSLSQAPLQTFLLSAFFLVSCSLLSTSSLYTSSHFLLGSSPFYHKNLTPFYMFAIGWYWWYFTFRSTLLFSKCQHSIHLKILWSMIIAFSRWYFQGFLANGSQFTLGR